MSFDRKVQDAGSASRAEQTAGPGVGKRTLAEQLVQRREDASTSAVGDVHAAAAHGTSGAPTTLPHFDQIQRLFGRHGVSHVQAHVGGPAAEVTISGAKDLIPGDWVYFKNFPDYGAKHPGGFWTGEHTMYLGDGKFQGFGTGVSTEAEINQKLLDNYNDGLPPAQQKKLADVPGLQKYARRPVADKMVH